MPMCDFCKEKIATVHITDLHNNTKSVHHYCETCATSHKAELFSSPQVQTAVVKEIVKQNYKTSVDDKKGQAAKKLKCPKCGMSLFQYNQNGRLGCSYDVEVFRNVLNSTLLRYHGSNEYFGKTPPTATDQDRVTAREIAETSRHLREAITCEDYEKAAYLRDRLKQLQNNIDTTCG